VLIKKVIDDTKPTLILDYGCGGGWLSLFLAQSGYNSVGVDISKNMVATAKTLCPTTDFIVCDAIRLPFRSDTFDFVIGISILHHLNLNEATTELRKMSVENSGFFFMEPSSLNPFSAFGRRLFPMESHTKGEKPFTPSNLKESLKIASFKVKKCFSTFFITFPLARFSKIAGLNPPSTLIELFYFFENVMEKMPFIQKTNSTIIVSGKIANTTK
jgi:SAM-dependent methyltransferase